MIRSKGLFSLEKKERTSYSTCAGTLSPFQKVNGSGVDRAEIEDQLINTPVGVDTIITLELQQRKLFNRVLSIAHSSNELSLNSQACSQRLSYIQR